MIDTLIDFFKKSEKETKGSTPDGVCPVCWGHQEYDNTVRKMYIDKQVDVNNHKANHSFIQQFVISEISGIKLVKKEKGNVCPTCEKVS